MSLIAGRGCRWPPRRDSVSPCAPLSGGGRDTHDGHENSPILVFFSNLLDEIYDSPDGVQDHWQQAQQSWTDFGPMVEMISSCGAQTLHAGNILQSLW